MTETKYPTEHAVAMNGIAKIDATSVHPALRLWSNGPTGVLVRIQAEMSRRGAHPARTVVLLPYAQLLPLVQGLWVQCYPDGFAPRFETTQNWSRALGAHGQESATDITFDVALDTLSAHALLVKAGLGEQHDALAALLVQAAHQLGPLAAACAPAARAAWAQTARLNISLGMEGPALVWEAALARVALEWAAVSSYRSDWLFAPAIRDSLECLVVVQGFAADPLTLGLQAFWGDKLATVVLAQPLGEMARAAEHSHVALHACSDAEDEALRGAACAMRRIEAGHYPVALVSSDRLLTRRMRALLEGAGVQIRDENGWKLSTSHSAAQVMALLKACVWNASSDAVIDWLKTAPLFASVVQDLEAAVRREQLHDWRHATNSPVLSKTPARVASCAQIAQVRAQLQGSHTLPQWLGLLRGALQTTGVWEGLQADGAGVHVLGALRLSELSSAAWQVLQQDALWSGRRMDLSAFTTWVNQALEAASFQPPYPAHEQVVILPMNQMLGRPFAALVLAGCDEVRLNPSPEPPGSWTPAQRAALGLPSREMLAQVMAQAWQHALQTPLCDVLWRTGDDAGEPLLPSALVQLVQLGVGGDAATSITMLDPRLDRAIASAPFLPPLPTGECLPVQHLSASAYDDLRQCPYRFFAMRLLGLHSVQELDGEVDKRDFGLWLHAVLQRFHESLLQQPQPDLEVRQHLLDQAAAATTEAMALEEGEFLPFAAAWPAVRSGYLDWLHKHEATGAAFTHGETMHKQSVGDVQLFGRIDRIDTLADGTNLVVDYKTEPLAKTSARVKDPMEDTQIAFYAALLPQDTLQGAYVNVGERDGTKSYPQPDLVQARDALIEGILHDMRHIAQGAVLPALGEGAACDYCHARGLCRKDFWAAP